MPIEFDPAKRDRTFRERGLDMARAEAIFAGATLTIADDRLAYGEDRFITVGHFDRRMVVIVWTWRGESRRIISMRKANAREKALYGPRLGS
ncbi:MAG: BrnT family toxin [Bradyrhizobium sp.]|nr:MAG: BrnT family toxin [Bradyrhizobium sp.]